MASLFATILIMTFFGVILVGWGMIVQAAMSNALRRDFQQGRQPCPFPR
jgi:hypothetical protein